ncbi:SusD/RagB family nutrient-binding outer membrane lipoprotein [Agriterribacter humi]|uniref:SusD/RagB family nutrient-binding outer membrane lipoprotein n=1 Tax=Agriterribacter humi TaxID=1104781 RepID=UPI00126537B0|nr:SusD/RagB family nutrient-binding outer membrane lipoprotein [Agriterribacter humi]
MKKIFFSCVAMTILLLTSCKKNITDLNQNPKRPSEVPSATLFSNAAINLADVMASTNVNTNNFRLFVQYWTETIYRDETRYNLNQRSISDRWWAEFYRDIIKDLTESSKLAETETLTLKDGEIKNRKAINDILMVYAYYHLVSSFGDIPYSEALGIENLQPVYDKAPEIYKAITEKLNAALGNLDENYAAYGNADIILNDDIAQWKKFGNSLKMRMGMLIADVDAATAGTMILEAAPNVINDNSENIMIHFLASPPNTNPVWEDIIQSGRHDFVAAKTLMDTLKKYNDPRVPLFFNEAITEGKGYAGQVPGDRATYNDFSAPASSLSAPEFPHTFFSYSEMEFLKAEAIERGIDVGGTAEEHYNNAIDASIEEWGGTSEDALVYRSQPSVKYSAAPGTYKEKIGLQSWLALYNRGYDAWTQWRRLDYPVLPIPSGALFASGETPAVIVRLTYPVVEQNLNKGNYEAASAAVGKDQITQKLWFDKY